MRYGKLAIRPWRSLLVSDKHGAPVVSSEGEELILVDLHDKPIGTASKAICHDGQGILHRAFSLFVFDPEGRLWLQQRSGDKRLWPNYWSNTCCSHPRAGEEISDAIHRRLQQELGMQSQLEFVFKFDYSAPYGDAGSERELCWVYVGRSDEPPQPNPNEISAVRAISWNELKAEMALRPQDFTPWFKLEVAQLEQQHGDVLGELTNPA